MMLIICTFYFFGETITIIDRISMSTLQEGRA